VKNSLLKSMILIMSPGMCPEPVCHPAGGFQQGV
jgi:hypothetical protein